MRLFLLVLFVPFAGLRAQSPADSVRQVVTDFFAAMRRSDTAGMRACLSPAVHFEATQNSPDAVPQLIQESVDNFMASVSRIAAGLLDERIEFGSILVDASIASVWTPYVFYYNGKYSHCGVNSFQLVRLNGKWLIQYLIDTRRRKCATNASN
jgi:hypothetical protein